MSSYLGISSSHCVMRMQCHLLIFCAFCCLQMIVLDHSKGIWHDAMDLFFMHSQVRLYQHSLLWVRGHVDLCWPVSRPGNRCSENHSSIPCCSLASWTKSVCALYQMCQPNCTDLHTKGCRIKPYPIPTTRLLCQQWLDVMQVAYKAEYRSILYFLYLAQSH